MFYAYDTLSFIDNDQEYVYFLGKSLFDQTRLDIWDFDLWCFCKTDKSFFKINIIKNLMPRGPIFYATNNQFGDRDHDEAPFCDLI